MHAQADFARRLDAVDGRDIALGQQLAPERIGEDHHFGNELVQRGAALARHDADPAVLDVKRVVQRPGGGARLSTPRLERPGEAKETPKLFLEWESNLRVGLEGFIEGVVLPMAKVRRDGHSFQPAAASPYRAVFFVNVDVERNGRTGRPLV